MLKGHAEIMGDSVTLINLFIATCNQIDSLWQFFVTVHLALVAALYGIERLRRLKNLEIIIFSTAYLLFSCINIRAKLDIYRLLIAIDKEIDINIKESNLEILRRYFSGVEYDDRVLVLLAVHIFSALAIATVVFINRYSSKQLAA